MDLVTREIIGEESEIEKETDEKHETDLPPEYCHYTDEGCEFLDSCLKCPLPQCLYDEPQGKQRWLKELRNRQIERLYGDGWRIKELALMLGLSRRTIQRALKSSYSPFLSEEKVKKLENEMR